MTSELDLADQSCENCMYERDGECRRYAPQPNQIRWPYVTIVEWCGEWKEYPRD